MWGDRHAWERERDCMYCELGGGVCGEIDTLGNEKETVCMCVCVCVMPGVWERSTTLLHQERFLDRRLLSTVAAPQLPAKVTFSPGYIADTW